MRRRHLPENFRATRPSRELFADQAFWPASFLPPETFPSGLGPSGRHRLSLMATCPQYQSSPRSARMLRYCAASTPSSRLQRVQPTESALDFDIYSTSANFVPGVLHEQSGAALTLMATCPQYQSSPR